ncbi:hypothetical protein CCUS01_09022 [Colletotrichum cuscutae]|uniref:Uncharacterized protein n=1 Tax=Colletotrichum cuscutae TaxID=1209917 RepID=A0AAI9XSN6_9PEZI|nr:hypothetical protein CCUS01_09022 [Colletotrichum cuscutae]
MRYLGAQPSCFLCKWSTETRLFDRSSSCSDESSIRGWAPQPHANHPYVIGRVVFSLLCCPYLASYITHRGQRSSRIGANIAQRTPRLLAALQLQLQLKPGVESEEKPPVPVLQGYQMQKAASRNSGLTEDSLLLPNAQPLLAEAWGLREWMRTPNSTILERIVAPLQVSRGASLRAHMPHRDDRVESLECSERYQALGFSPWTIWGIFELLAGNRTDRRERTEASDRLALATSPIKDGFPLCLAAVVRLPHRRYREPTNS